MRTRALIPKTLADWARRKVRGSPFVRFMSRVRVRPLGCWERAGNYTMFRLGGRDAPSVGQHRYMYELAYGPIPDGMWVLHRCDNPKCVRPTHLFLGTIADNNQDKARKGRSRGTFKPGFDPRRRPSVKAQS